MDLAEWIHALHFDTERAKPSEWEPDWTDAPLSYKLYKNVPGIPLSAEVPLALENREAGEAPDIRAFGHFLWYTFGIVQGFRTIPMPDMPLQANDTGLSVRRPVPSGGGLYPNEMYVYLKLSDIPSGVYHYDAAHHRLALLRAGRFDGYLAEALGGRCRAGDCFGFVFVSVYYWKNFFKYHNFSYRLQALDTGVLLGQLLETAKRFGFSTRLFFQFADRAVNRLPGLSENEESVYAAAALSSQPDILLSQARSHDTSADLLRFLPPVQHRHTIKSRGISPYPFLLRMNEAARQESAADFRLDGGRFRPQPIGGKLVELPRAGKLAYDFAAVSRKRSSPENEFVLRSVPGSLLAAVLQETFESFRYDGDLDPGQGAARCRLSLYACLYAVNGVEEGAYHYDPEIRALKQLRTGDLRAPLQYAMTLHNLNLFQVPICFHIAGDRHHGRREWGLRGYRMQQMEAGMLAQRLLLAASAAGLGGRPLLGFDSAAIDRLYGLERVGQTALIQIPIGPCRPRAGWEAGLHR